MKSLTLRLGICFIAEVFDLAIFVLKVKKNQSFNASSRLIQRCFWHSHCFLEVI